MNWILTYADVVPDNEVDTTSSKYYNYVYRNAQQLEYGVSYEMCKVEKQKFADWYEKYKMQENIQQLKRKNQQLEQKNQQLLDCILQMSQIVYS